MAATLAYETVWIDKARYDDAERQYFEKLAKVCKVYSKYILVKRIY